jgi:protein-S-isoprenylcysteine O-methyltransferase Ste14
LKESWVADKSWAERAVRRFRVPLGFLFAIAFLVFARPSAASLVASLLLVVPGLWLRGYAAGYVNKNAEITRTGPYAWTRNPLYLGSLLAATGFVSAGRNAWLLIAFLLLFAAIYGPVIWSEEQFLLRRFPAYAEYMRAVPRLFPNPFRHLRRRDAEARGEFSPQRYRKHREYNSAIGAAVLYAVLIALLLLRQNGVLSGQ